MAVFFFTFLTTYCNHCIKLALALAGTFQSYQNNLCKISRQKKQILVKLRRTPDRHQPKKLKIDKAKINMPKERRQKKSSAPGPPKGADLEAKASRQAKTRSQAKAVEEPKPSTSSAEDPGTAPKWNGEKISNVRPTLRD